MKPRHLATVAGASHLVALSQPGTVTRVIEQAAR